jgi:hypothetical protein
MLMPAPAQNRVFPFIHEELHLTGHKLPNPPVKFMKATYELSSLDLPMGTEWNHENKSGWPVSGLKFEATIS